MKTKLKISPSLLDQWRVVKAGLYNTTPDRIREYILGDYTPSEPASRGTAYHLILEHGAEKYAHPIFGHRPPQDSQAAYELQHEPATQIGTIYKVHEPELGITWTFSEQAVEPAILVRELYPDAVHEAWGEYETQVKGYNIVSRMRFDTLNFLQIVDHKTTSSKKKWTDYYDSMQWRLYHLGLPEATEITYHVFQMPKIAGKEPHHTEWCRHEVFTIGRQDDTEKVVHAAMEEFINWLETQPDLMEKLIVD